MYRRYAILPFPDDIDRHDFGNYVSGFVDGEGCFRLGYIHSRPNATFAITLRADDSDILDLIRSYLRCGKPIYITAGQKRGNESPTAMYQINSTVDLYKIIIPHFQQFPLRAKKMKDFAIWRQGVEFLYRRRLVVSRDAKGRRRQGKPHWSKSEMTRWDEFVTLIREQRKFIHPVHKPKQLLTILP